MSYCIAGIHSTTPDGIYAELADAFESLHTDRKAPGRTEWTDDVERSTRDLNSFIFYEFLITEFPWFQSDGCSKSLDWDHLWACWVHDLLYRSGGTEEDRIAADRWLGQAIMNIGMRKLARYDSPLKRSRIYVSYVWRSVTRHWGPRLFGGRDWWMRFWWTIKGEGGPAFKYVDDLNG